MRTLGDPGEKRHWKKGFLVYFSSFGKEGDGERKGGIAIPEKKSRHHDSWRVRNVTERMDGGGKIFENLAFLSSGIPFRFSRNKTLNLWKISSPLECDGDDEEDGYGHGDLLARVQQVREQHQVQIRRQVEANPVQGERRGNTFYAMTMLALHLYVCVRQQKNAS